MRALILALAIFAAGCATEEARVQGGVVRVPLPSTARSEWPFPNAPRGSAIAPPAQAALAAQTAPPEGTGPGGVDFGQWRGADPAAYGPAFQAQMRQRFAGQGPDQIRADLQRNGFACEDGANMQCRIEIMERQCGFEWYVVVEANRGAPVAGFDQMCLGANPSRR